MYFTGIFLTLKEESARKCGEIGTDMYYDKPCEKGNALQTAELPVAP